MVLTTQRPNPDHLLTRMDIASVTEEKDQKSEVYRFGDCVVDADRRELTRDGDAVTMQPKAFELLLYLLRNRHRAVDKDELQDALWPRSIVTETALTRCVMKARRAVGDDAEKQHAIKTVHGHGYRFTAEIEEAVEPAAPEPIENVAPRKPFPWGKLAVPGTMAALCVAIVSAWLMFSPPALSGPIRLAVLPVENATGDDNMAWVTTGLMAFMDRMFQDQGIETVSSNQVTGLAGDTPISQLVATGSDFRDKITQSAAATHVLGARIEDSNGLYRITYSLADANGRPTRRTMVGQEPTQLIKDVVSTVVALIANAEPDNDDERSVSNDEFLNQAFARAMVLYREGRYEDARELFEVVIEQEPHLFWPRYERALSMRNMRDYDAAERELIALRNEVPVEGHTKQHASIENALGIMYMNQQRHDEARVAYERSIAVSDQAGNAFRRAVAYENMGLLEKGLGDYEKAFDWMSQAEQTYLDADVRSLPGNLHNNMSGVLIQMGQFESALERSELAVEAFRYTGEHLNESYALNRIADIYTRLRDFDTAITAAENALAIRRSLEDDFGIASSLITLADISSLQGDFTKALQYAQQAQDISTDINDHRIRVSSLVRIARNQQRLGDLEQATATFRTLESTAQTANDGHNVWRARLGIADTLISRGLYDDALAIGNELLQDARDKDRRREETAALRIYAAVYVQQDRHSDAIDALSEALDIAIAIEDTVVQASLHLRLAESWLALGDAEGAGPHVIAGAQARPDDYGALKIQAGLAALLGDAPKAVEYMSAARTRAGESWSDDDDRLLTQYRASADAAAR